MPHSSTSLIWLLLSFLLGMLSLLSSVVLPLWSPILHAWIWGQNLSTFSGR